MKDQNHFSFIFYYIVGCTTAGLTYLFLITFIVIPEANTRHADTVSGFFMGTLITACLYYLTGGNPTQKKGAAEPGTTHAEVTAVITSEPKEETEK
jgi:hypothetical protein